MRPPSASRIRRRFQRLSRIRGQVPHALRTLSPLGASLHPVRLACLIHAASVHSEPGSNSPLRKIDLRFRLTSLNSRGAPTKRRPVGRGRASHSHGPARRIALFRFQRAGPAAKGAGVRPEPGAGHNMARHRRIASRQVHFHGNSFMDGAAGRGRVRSISPQKAYAFQGVLGFYEIFACLIGKCHYSRRHEQTLSIHHPESPARHRAHAHADAPVGLWQRSMHGA